MSVESTFNDNRGFLPAPPAGLVGPSRRLLVLARLLFFGGLLLWLGLWRSAVDVPNIDAAVPFLFAAALTAFGLAVSGAPWGVSTGGQPGLVVLGFVVCAVLIVVTRGASSWVGPAAMVYAAAEARLQPAARARQLAAAAAAVVLLPLVFDFCFVYLSIAVIGLVTLGLALGWIRRLKQQIGLRPTATVPDKATAGGTALAERQRLAAEVDHLTYHDRLTGLYNRQRLAELWDELTAAGTLPVAVILGDVNGLKLVNDAFGRAKGDEVLRGVAAAIQGTVRVTDILCRWGGDEFAVVLPGLGQKAGEGIAIRIHYALSEAAPDPIPLSMTLVVATRTALDQTLDAVLSEAESSMYRRKLTESRSVHSAIINSLQKTLRERTRETEEHAARLRELCLRLGDLLGLSPGEISDLSLVALLHDIGKVGIPDSVLNSSDSLSAAEWKIMKQHPEIGYRIAAATPSLAHIADSILSHHERWDGSGYPRGLKGTAIPLISRIVAIADAYETMVSGRPYRPRLTPAQAVAELRRCAGTQFDPYLVRVLVRALRGSLTADRSAGDAG